jgi:hypothetical protein
MKKFASLGFGAALALGSLAVPSQASVFLAFSTTATGGTFAMPSGTTNGTFSLSAVSGVLFTRLTVTNDAISSDNGAFTLTGTGSGNCTSASGATMSLSGNTLSLWGAISGAPFSNLSSGCNLLASFTDTNSGGFTGVSSGTGTSATVSLNNATSITESALLLSDLSVAASSTPGTALLSGAGWSGSGSSGSFSSTSEQFTFSLVQTPEPFSFLLMGTGLAAIILIARKRSGAV